MHAIASAADAWQRQPNEPILWYGRFDAYRLLGTSRSIEQAFQSARKSEGLTAQRPGAAWYDASKKYSWQSRAEAWDEAERVRLRSIEETRRFDAREQRISVTRRLLDAALNVLEIADLPMLDMTQAREMLPTIRMLLRDALIIQRQEFGAPTIDNDGSASMPAFTADDLIAAKRALESHRGDTVTSAVEGSENVIVGKDIASTVINVYPNK